MSTLDDTGNRALEDINEHSEIRDTRLLLWRVLSGILARSRKFVSSIKSHRASLRTLYLTMTSRLSVTMDKAAMSPFDLSPELPSKVLKFVEAPGLSSLGSHVTPCDAFHGTIPVRVSETYQIAAAQNFHIISEMRPQAS